MEDDLKIDEFHLLLVSFMLHGKYLHSFIGRFLLPFSRLGKENKKNDNYIVSAAMTETVKAPADKRGKNNYFYVSMFFFLSLYQGFFY